MTNTAATAYLIQHVATLFARRYEQVIQDQLGIGFSQFKILLVLQKHASSQQREIALALGQTEASISRQVKLLAERGMLSSHQDPDNHRRHVTAVTDHGAETIKIALECLESEHHLAVNGMAPADQQQLSNLLQTLHDQICQTSSTCAAHHDISQDTKQHTSSNGDNT